MPRRLLLLSSKHASLAGHAAGLIALLLFAGCPERLPAASPLTKSQLWSIQPLQSPAPPSPKDASWTTRNPIDLFIHAGLRKHGLQPSPEASPQVLIRRLYFDLIGLPPKPEAVDRFVADRSPGAWEALVDELLNSRHYGERWARHWLDVVHYGETHGYDKDKPRPDAWPYRDYVIRSFNQDKPFTQFIHEQIAGDVLYPDTRDGIEGLGFLAAGPWDFIGHAEVPETKIDGRIARHLDRDDMVANTMQTFNSLTVQCAQCHDHKFDPISQEDYYKLQAVFAAVDRTQRTYDQEPATAARRRSLRQQIQSLEQEQQALESLITGRGGAPLAEAIRRLSQASKKPDDHPAFGFHSAIESTQDNAKWVQLDLGQSAMIKRVVVRPCRDDFNGIGEGFGFPVRYRIEASNDSEFRDGVQTIVDRTSSDQPNPKLTAQVFEVSNISARHVRISATKLAPRQNDYIFAIAELEVLSSDDRNLAKGALVTSLDSVEAPPRWQRSNICDGHYPGSTVATAVEIASLQSQQEALRKAATLPPEFDRSHAISAQLGILRSALEELPAPMKVYAAGVHTGSGAFSGTGAKGGKPRPIHVLKRGNVQTPAHEVGPGSLAAVPSGGNHWNLPSDHAEGDRRAALARWLSDPQNPLTWRSIVNRVWQQHFGTGLVDTPGDFGRMGGLPSHPELLDWLAADFRDRGQSLKRLHRLIVTSATYRQTSDENGRGADLDGGNRLLWRMNRRKLEAEAIRDTVLSVSSKLDLTPGGPSFQDFVIEKPEHSPHYQYHLHDPEDPKAHRRSIYRFIVRSQPQPWMTVLDCADPSMQVAKRNESISPLQALAFMNNSLMLSMSGHFAHQLQASGRDLPTQVQEAFRTALSRNPSREEADKLITYASHHGLTNTCRVLFNMNEFSFVD